MLTDSTRLDVAAFDQSARRPPPDPINALLNRDGRHILINAYERRMAHEIKHPVLGYRVT